MKKYSNKVVTDFDVSSDENIRVEVNDADWINFPSAAFFDHLMHVKNNNGETWMHDPESKSVMIASYEDHYGFSYIMGRGSLYSYERFFRSFSLELNGLITQYVQSLAVVQDEKVAA